MARDGERTKLVDTRTRERVPVKGDAFQGGMREVIENPGKLGIEGYCAAVWSLDETEATIHVYKMVGPGGYTKKGEVMHREYDAKEVEPYLMATWGPGRYQLRVNLHGRYYSPVSVVYAVGEEERETAPGADVDSVMAEAVKRVGNLQTLEKLHDITSPKSGMDMGGMAALMQAMATIMRPDTSTATAALEAANRRADAAESRNHDLMLKMMDGRQGLAQGATPLLGELFKYLKPEHLQLLMNPSTAEKPWWETVAELAREFAPALQAVVLKVMEQSGVPTGPPRAALPAGPADKMSVVATTPPADGGGTTMPIPLNEEQTFAKGLLLDFIKTNDFANALGALENFPGFVPSEAGPMPMGVAMIQRIDPAMNPKVYLSQLMMIMPEIKGMMTEAQAFITYIQKRILADDDAAARQTVAAPDPLRPTGSPYGEGPTT